MLHSNEVYNQNEFHLWYEYILDIINTKLYKEPQISNKQTPKNVCVVYYENKGLDDIDLSKVLNSPIVLDKLPDQLKTVDNIPKVTYRLGTPIRNKIFNYKQTVESIILNDDGSINVDNCMCENSPLCDQDHGHIITGDLRIVENSKLRKLLTKGPNFREPKTVNYTKCMNTIKTSLETFISSMANKFGFDESELLAWKDKVLSELNHKVHRLKQHKHPKKTNPVLRNADVLQYLDELHRNFVVVPIDKAPNNIGFICKTFYVKRLLSEVGIVGPPSDTYKVSAKDSNDVITNNITVCKRFGMKVNENDQKLPIMYLMPKMHKKPTGARFIVASSSCSTKPLSKAISNVFKLIFDQVHQFNLKAKFYSRLNLFWVVQNSFPIKEKLDVINTRKKAKCISTYDFSTLYTNIPHTDLLVELDKIIDFVFDGGKCKYIGLNSSKAFWCSSKRAKTIFTRSSLKLAVKHLICESYFVIGNKMLIQTIGIPMGIDPAPFWANLYLHRHEFKFMRTLISNDIARARKFHGCTRFIDDMCCLNDGGEFGKSYNEIYPDDLQLKCEHTGNHATFLDLDIIIEDGIFVYKLFDKRDDFPFHIVRMPDRGSNIPSYIFYGTVLSEYLRIARSTLRLNDFLPRVSNLVVRMLNQGGQYNKLFKQFSKAMARHPDPFTRYNITPNNIIMEIKHLIDLRGGGT